MARATPSDFDPTVVQYVNLYARELWPSVGPYRLDSWAYFGQPAGWSPVSEAGLRPLEHMSGLCLVAVLEHTSQASGIPSHIAVERCIDDPRNEFQPGGPWMDIAVDRARSTPGGGQVAAPPVEFSVAGSFATYIPIAVPLAPFERGGTVPSLFAMVVIKAPGRGYPLHLFTPWADVNETLPALRTVLDTWAWG